MRGIARPARSLRRRAPTDLHASRKTRTRVRPTPAVPAGPCAMLRSRCPPAPTRAAVRDAEGARRHADLQTHCRGSGLHRTHPTNAASPCRVEVLGREDTAPSALHGAAARSLDREPGARRGLTSSRRIALITAPSRAGGARGCRLARASVQHRAPMRPMRRTRSRQDRALLAIVASRQSRTPGALRVQIQSRGGRLTSRYTSLQAHAVVTSILARSPSRRRLLRPRARQRLRPRRRRRSRACA